MFNRTTAASSHALAVFPAGLRHFAWILIFLLFGTAASAQMKRIAVIGSSTAVGYGLPGYVSGNNHSAIDSWVNKMKAFYKSAILIDTVYNIAQSSTNPYMALPTGTVVPPNRDAPNPALNITRALGFLPRPDVVIVNYPTNGYDYMSIAEIMYCLRTIREAALAAGVQCFVTTTQPRNGFSKSERIKLSIIRDSIMAAFGKYAIDFFSDVVGSQTGLDTLKINPLYDQGDGVHLNVAGHSLLYQRVMQANVLSLGGALPTRFKYVKPRRLDANTLELEFVLSEVEPGDQVYVNIKTRSGNRRIRIPMPENAQPNKKYTVTVKLEP